MRIDLHLHSTASDGTLTPEALVDAAASLGLVAIALTDHDSVGGVAAATRAIESFGDGQTAVVEHLYDSADTNGQKEGHD